MIESDEALWPWQGAALWEYVLEGGIKCPVIQVRKGWKGKKEKFWVTKRLEGKKKENPDLSP